MSSLKYLGNAERMSVNLGAAYTAGSGTITLTAGHGARLPSTGDFWLVTRVGTYCAFKVTARSSDTLTVTAGQDGTSDISLSLGTELNWSLTASALDQLKIDIATSPGVFLKSMPWPTLQTVTLTTGINDSTTSVDFPLFASEPATPYWVWIGTEQMKVTGVSGTTHTVVRGDGKTTAASASAGATVTLATWFKVALGSATVGRQVQGRFPNGQIYSVGAGENANDTLLGMVIKLPSAPWTLTMELFPIFHFWKNYSAIGVLMWEVSTGKAVYWNCPFNVDALQIIQMQSHDNSGGFGSSLSSAGTFGPMSGTFSQQCGPTPRSPWLIRIQDDGANWVTSVSVDGENYWTIQTCTRNQTITPTHAGMHVEARGNGNVGVQCSGYTLTTP